MYEQFLYKHLDFYCSIYLLTNATYTIVNVNRIKKYEEALNAVEEALRLNPSSSTLWNNKGNTLYNLKRYEEALQAYEEALCFDSSDAIMWNNKGGTLKALGREKEAQKCYEKAHQLGYKGPSITQPQAQISKSKANVST